MTQYYHTLYLFTLLFTISTSAYSTDRTITTETSYSPCPLTKSPNRGIDIPKVIDYHMPHIIARYCKDNNVSTETAKIHEVELKRFLILAADDDDALSMLSKEVDNLWHTFLLFTKEYQNFCNEMFGKFIHHMPLIEEA